MRLKQYLTIHGKKIPVIRIKDFTTKTKEDEQNKKAV